MCCCHSNRKQVCKKPPKIWFSNSCVNSPLQSETPSLKVHFVISTLESLNRWFSWGVASLLEGKSRGLCLVQLCALHEVHKRSCFSLKVKGPLYSCLLIAHLPSGSRTLKWHLETIYNPNSRNIFSHWIKNIFGIKSGNQVYPHLSEEVDKSVCT